MRFWTEERQAELRHRWKNGELAREIAEAMGTTKNAVIGARKQYGLPLRCAGRLPQQPDHERKMAPPPKPRDVLPTVPQPGWPTRDQLMSGRAR